MPPRPPASLSHTKCTAQVVFLVWAEVRDVVLGKVGKKGVVARLRALVKEAPAREYNAKGELVDQAVLPKGTKFYSALILGRPRPVKFIEIPGADKEVVDELNEKIAKGEIYVEFVGTNASYFKVSQKTELVEVDVAKLEAIARKIYGSDDEDEDIEDFDA